VDETVGQQADPKDTVADRVSSADFSGAFASVAGATYALSVSDASGAPVPDGVGSGVFAVDRGPGAVGQGQEILLYNTAGGIEGRITDPIDDSGEWVYFTISTDDAGTITLSQSFRDPNNDYNLTVFNPDGSNPDDVVSLDGTGLYQINLTQTVGGASESVDLAAGVFSFADAVPEARNDFEGNALVVSGGSVEFNVFVDNGAGPDLTGVDQVTGIEVGGGSITFTTPGKGSLVYDGFGGFTYTAAEGAFGSDTFEYTITDDDGDASTATVYLTIEESVVVQAAPLNAAGGDADTFVAVEGAPDVFAWSLGDETADGDLIIGFNLDEDAINIADLLVGLDTTDLSQFLDVGLADDGASTVIKVSASGDFGSADQVITVQDVDLFAGVDFGDLSAVNSALQSLVDAGKLIAE
jgi:hypothetical protein